MRDKNKGKWVGPAFRFGYRTENERLHKVLDYNAATYDYS